MDTLSTEDMVPFLGVLSKIGGLSGKFKQVMDSPNGRGIKITYTDGGFTLITVSEVNAIDAIYVGHYDSDENVEGYYDISWQEMIDDFRALTSDYFEQKI